MQGVYMYKHQMKCMHPYVQFKCMVPNEIQLGVVALFGLALYIGCRTCARHPRVTARVDSTLVGVFHQLQGFIHGDCPCSIWAYRRPLALCLQPEVTVSLTVLRGV